MNDEKERIPSQIDRILAVLESGGTLTALVPLWTLWKISGVVALLPASPT